MWIVENYFDVVSQKYFSSHIVGNYLGHFSQNSKYENLRTTICESVSQLSNVLLGSKNWFKLTARMREEEKGFEKVIC